MDCEPSTSIIFFDVNNSFHFFLSFQGSDVRNTFLVIFTELSEAWLRVFLDNEEFEKGKAIDFSLQIAIESSDILIPIFSKGYAESTWCLEEVVQMCRSNGFIIPLFYDVHFPRRSNGRELCIKSLVYLEGKFG
ncbi:hypothetical protein SUGI_0034440 [Cryptomeria japonica]|nr:hypothetical protein SUGI_0034440 [Cryptomeria japonica]